MNIRFDNQSRSLTELRYLDCWNFTGF